MNAFEGSRAALLRHVRSVHGVTWQDEDELDMTDVHERHAALPHYGHKDSSWDELRGLVDAVDLQMPPRMLLPKFHCMLRLRDVRSADLGGGVTVRRTQTGACINGCCEAETLVEVLYPVEGVPHCGTCDCADVMSVTMSMEQCADMLRIIGGQLAS